MSFMDDLKRWAKGEDDDDLEEELEVVSNGPGRSRAVRTEEVSNITPVFWIGLSVSMNTEDKQVLRLNTISFLRD